MDGARRFGSISYNLHGRLQSGWSQPHSARASVAIHLPMGSRYLRLHRPALAQQSAVSGTGAAREWIEKRQNCIALGPSEPDSYCSPRYVIGIERFVVLDFLVAACAGGGFSLHRGLWRFRAPPPLSPKARLCRAAAREALRSGSCAAP